MPQAIPVSLFILRKPLPKKPLRQAPLLPKRITRSSSNFPSALKICGGSADLEPCGLWQKGNTHRIDLQPDSADALRRPRFPNDLIASVFVQSFSGGYCPLTGLLDSSVLSAMPLAYTRVSPRRVCTDWGDPVTSLAASIQRQQGHSMSGVSFSVKRAIPRFSFIAEAEVAAPSTGKRLLARVSELSSRGCYVDTPEGYPAGTVVCLRIRYGGSKIG